MSEDSGMAVLAGIDEAGYGPILGPLVVSAAVFSLPDKLVSADLWQVLRSSVAKSRKRLAGRLLVADSKKVYSRSAGVGSLQRTVLACLRYLGESPATATELIQALCPDCMARLDGYPWYRQLKQFRLSAAGAAGIDIAVEVFGKDLSANAAKLLCLRSVCLDEAYYNRLVAALKNKAEVLFGAVCRLVAELFDSADMSVAGPADNLQIIIDRQSGRVRYASALMRMFPSMELSILCEGPSDSSYELKAGGKKMRLHFVVDADQRFLPVSLASMVSKYLREIMIESLNRYFAGYCPDLKPTAGYWKDGLRFIEDLKKHIPAVEYDSNQLIRCR
jgi:ribonuclease HII